MGSLANEYVNKIGIRILISNYLQENIPMNKRIWRLVVNVCLSVLNVLKREFFNNKKPKKRRNGYDDFYQGGPPGNY